MMRELVKIENIEEFEVASGIPRSAITDEILSGVRHLNEKEEIEPFLREILPDKNETAHTSTEIADILTIQVTCSGKAVLTAFVNKGKATQKVRAKDVSHQFIRIPRQIPNLGLMVFLAVGDIQDDAKSDFLDVAYRAKVDYMIVDAIDVARLFIANHKICPKDGNPYVAGKCRKCGTPITEPIKITIDLYEDPIYTIWEHTDNSHGLAKRYSANIVVDPHYPKATLREIIKNATWELRQSKYYRSYHTKSRFGDKNADCVYLFVYPTLQDTQTFNWICRTLWISHDLAEDSRPNNINGDEWLGEIEIDWNENYYAFKNNQNVGKKEEWIEKIETHIPEIDKMIEYARKLLDMYEHDEIGQQELKTILGKLEKKALGLSRDTTSQKFPPFECEECDRFFQMAVCSFHNIFVPFMERGTDIWKWETKLALMRNYLKKYDEDKNGFLHELRKVRT